MATQILDAFVSQEEAMREQDCQTGKVYMNLAQRLLGEGSLPVRMAPNRPTIRASETFDKNLDEQTTTTTTTNRVMARPHSLVMKHKSIHTIYYKWYGLENYKNSPVEGGIASLEKQFKTKWRVNFSPAEKQHFSRLQKVIKGIEEQGRCEAKEPDKILKEWDGLYQNEAKSSVTKILQIIQEMGLVIMRKARGKTRINEQPE
jgi:hypothetical protein